jgi:polysaccharide deacetylase family protein (PEP-CTERM system associated)
MSVQNVLSFDVEEYFHGGAYAHVPPAQWDTLERRLPGNMEKLLSMLGTKHRATFFFVGWVAEQYPEIVKEVHRDGHEIGCHSHMHRYIWDQTPAEFQADAIRAKETLEGIIGDHVLGYRAPTFSVTQKTLWALDILREVGFVYDSRIFPIHHDRNGIPDAPRSPYRLASGIGEIPLSTVRCFTYNLPFGGGGYFRLYPYWLTRMCIRLRNRRGEPFVFYQHPWEIDRGKVMRPNSVMAWLRRHVMIGHPEEKLQKLLSHYHFVPMTTYLECMR